MVRTRKEKQLGNVEKREKKKKENREQKSKNVKKIEKILQKKTAEKGGKGKKVEISTTLQYWKREKSPKKGVGERKGKEKRER